MNKKLADKYLAYRFAYNFKGMYQNLKKKHILNLQYTDENWKSETIVYTAVVPNLFLTADRSTLDNFTADPGGSNDNRE